MGQVDRTMGLVGNIAFKAPCLLATTASLGANMAGLAVIDGVQTVAGDRVLRKNDANAILNGIWVADTGVWNRAEDMDGSLDAANGTLVLVTSGVASSRQTFQLMTPDPVVIGTTAITFAGYNPITFPAALAASPGSSLVGFIQAGADAIVRTAQDKSREQVSVMDFGATDANTGAQNKAAFELAIASNRDILVNDGHTFVVSGISVTGLSNFRIHGAGTIQLQAGINQRVAVLFIANSTDFKVDYLHIDGNKAGQTDATNDRSYNGILVVVSNRFSVTNNLVENCFAGAGINLVDNAQTVTNFETNAIVAHNTIRECGIAGSIHQSDGIFANSDNTIIESNQILNVTDTGIAGDYAHNLQVKNNNIRGDSTLDKDNRMVQGIASLGAFHWQITGNTVEWAQLGIIVTLSGHAAVAPYLSENIKISGNTVRNIDSTVLPGDGISDYPAAEGVSVIDNTVDTAKRGIAIVSQKAVIALNRVNNSKESRGIYAGGANMKVLYNVIQNSATDGIYTAGEAIQVFGNHIETTGGNGIDYASVSARAGWNTFGGIGAAAETNNGAVLYQGLEAGVWTDVTGIRIAGTVYKNTIGKRLKVQIICDGAAGTTLDSTVQVDTVVGLGTAITVSRIGFLLNAGGAVKWTGTHSVEIPPGHYYRLNLNVGTMFAWAELDE